MLRKYNLEIIDMISALVIWICMLPIGFFVVQFLGWAAGVSVAIGLLILVIAFCWAICGWKAFQNSTKY